MPQWLAGELGYVLTIMGFLMLVREWWHVFTTHGNTLARDSLRAYLLEWRNVRDTEHGTASENRTAIFRRMRQVLREIRDTHQQRLFTEYTAQLEHADPADTARFDALDRAFAVGTPIEETEKRSRRRTLMIIGAILVVLGSLGQMVSTYPAAFGPFCRTEHWQCPYDN